MSKNTPPREPVINEHVLNSLLASRQGLLDKLFDPRRDIDQECGYSKTISNEEYRVMYGRELGRRVVNVYTDESWKVLPSIYEDEDADVTTPFEASFALLNKRHRLLHYMQRADELSGVGQYGVILWGLSDGLKLHEPVAGSEVWEEATGQPTTTTGSLSILYIRVLDASLVTIASYEKDESSPRYGQPLTYTLRLADPRAQEASGTAASPDLTSVTAHWSRITHIADNRQTSEVLGSPRMEPVWNRLYDLRKVLGGSGEMFWRGGFPGVSLETQPGLENAVLDEETTRTMMASYMNGMQRYLALTGMTAKSLTTQISSPGPTFEVQVKAICVCLGVPYRVFMGIEEGVVSGDQATEAWNSRLVNRQHRYITPMIIDPIISRLTAYGALEPTATPYGWTVEWPELSSPSSEDKAGVAERMTGAMAKYVAGGVEALMPPMQYLTLVCGLEEAEAKTIMEEAARYVAETDDLDDDAGNDLDDK